VKVLLVSDNGVLAGGAERVSLVLRDGLRSRGHDARLFATTSRPVAGENPADYTCFGSESGLRLLLQFANPFAVMSLSRILDSFNPDVVHVRMFFSQLSPLILPLLRDFRCLLHLGSYQTICPLNTRVLPDGKQCMATAGRACHRAGCISALGLARTALQLGAWRRWRGVFGRTIANSAGLAATLAEGGLRVDDVIWNGTTPSPPRPPLEDPPTVAYAGRLVPKKGVSVLLRAMAIVRLQVPNCRLLIAGDGPDRADIEALCGRLGLDGNVTMLGHLPARELAGRLGPAWVVAVPSVYEEPFANTAIEAMMRGTAVVASAVGGFPEIVEDGVSGLLVPRGNPGALAAALLAILTDRALAERIGVHARARALDRFSSDQMVTRFLEEYQRLAPSRDRQLEPAS
jgi:glycosyltransferase involved in cell wall biosynthesis